MTAPLDTTSLDTAPAPLRDLLATVPRAEPMYAGVTATFDGGEGPIDVRLRILSVDPLEGERDDAPDRFVASHPQGVGASHEVIGYLSFGQAELDADEVGWDRLLTRTATAVRLAVAASGDAPIGRAHGPDPLVDLTLTEDAADEATAEVTGAVTGWQTEGWEGYTIGVFVDLAEAEDGPLGFPDEPLVPSDPSRTTAGCAACDGEVLQPPHVPAALLQSLCREHTREHDEWVSARLPEATEETRTLFALIMAMGTPNVCGIGAGLRAIELGASTPAELLHRARAWFDDPGGLSAIYADHDDLSQVIHEAATEIRAAEGLDPALSALDDIRFLIPQACWLADLDALLWIEDDDPRWRPLLDHLVADHEDEPGALHGAGEMHEQIGDEDTAVDLFRRAHIRGIAAGQPQMAELGESGLRRLGHEPPQPTSKVGRNDPCPCDSGRKFKRCCGR